MFVGYILVEFLPDSLNYEGGRWKRHPSFASRNFSSIQQSWRVGCCTELAAIRRSPPEGESLRRLDYRHSFPPFSGAEPLLLGLSNEESALACALLGFSLATFSCSVRRSVRCSSRVCQSQETGSWFAGRFPLENNIGDRYTAAGNGSPSAERASLGIGMLTITEVPAPFDSIFISP